MLAVRNRFQSVAQIDSIDCDVHKREFESAMEIWLPNLAASMSPCVNRHKSFFYLTGPPTCLKWAERNKEASVSNVTVRSEQEEEHLQQKFISKQTATHFLADVPNSVITHRTRTDSDSRRLLGLKALAEGDVDANTGNMLDGEVLVRDKIAADMLSLTEELRSTQMALGDRIRSDLGVLATSHSVAQANADTLAAVSRRVREELGHKFGICVWVTFLLSIVVFFWMIIFIKFTPKGTLVS
ncbi:unnamed protein product [Mesocestoides corti]|uniref:Vesicle transport protein USE1 n=1 Tax=Mesocestoides corti TaxID=53468 RepID=A0A3P6HL10_MESCO|nr:unnamed protein product [Mesocestoides corti]